MPTECAHTLSSGQKCQAPARTGSSFCHHHSQRTHLDPHPREQRESEPLVLPPLQDKCAILVAVSEVIHAASERRIKCSEARTLLMALKFASRLMTELDESRFSSPSFESDPYSESALQNTPPQPAQSARPAPAQPTAHELDRFVQTLQNATIQQLRRQTEAKQKGWSFDRVGQSDHEDRAVAALAASANHGEPALSR
jgi:hypothetical protein